MQDVWVKLNSQFQQDGHKDTINYKVEGKLLRSGRYSILSYQEPNVEDDSFIKVTIKFNQEEVILLKEGNITQELNFKKVNAYGIYEVSGFNFKLDIKVDKLLVEENSIFLEYELFVEKSPSGHFQIKIEIGEL